MAEKRKTPDPVSDLEVKKQKMAYLPIDSYTVNKVLPVLPNKTFDSYMLKTGPELWKESIKTLSLEDSKKLFLLILRRKDTLAQAIAVYFTLWGQETYPPRHLYDLGFGGYFRQTLLPGREDYVYMYLINKIGVSRHIYPLLPDLKQNQHYYCHNNKNFEICTGFEKEERIDTATLSQSEDYFKKLISALTCQKMERWSECFAYSLSALDAYDENFSYLDDVLCFIAHSGTKMSLPLQWCCNVLKEARLIGTSCDEAWKRILVFQEILIGNGFFDLEKEVFLESEPIFAKNTMFYQLLVENHIVAKLEEVENNLAFQYVRQKFHDECEEFCERSPCLKEGFGTTANHLFNIDTLAQKITTKGVKEYFRGYFYLYSTMMAVYKKTVDDKTLCEINLAKQFFLLAKEKMQQSDVHYKDLDLVLSFIKKDPLTIENISSQFAKNVFVKNTLGSSRFLFRAMLITMYWDNIFQHVPLMNFVSAAREMDAKVTNGYGYRGPLLNSCLKILDITFRHRKDKDISDYPTLVITPEKQTTLDEAIENWKKEKEILLNQINENTNEKKGLTSEMILQKNNLAEQVFAFGYQIVEARTSSSNENV